VQTCALPIYFKGHLDPSPRKSDDRDFLSTIVLEACSQLPACIATVFEQCASEHGVLTEMGLSSRTLLALLVSSSSCNGPVTDVSWISGQTRRVLVKATIA